MYKEFVCFAKIIALSLSFLLGIYLMLYFAVLQLSTSVHP